LLSQRHAYGLICKPRSIEGRGRKDLLGICSGHQTLYLKRREETGNVELRPILGQPHIKGAALEDWLPSQLETNYDLTLEEHHEAFKERTGVPVSASTG
jgi:hypothetical protein